MNKSYTKKDLIFSSFLLQKRNPISNRDVHGSKFDMLVWYIIWIKGPFRLIKFFSEMEEAKIQVIPRKNNKETGRRNCLQERTLEIYRGNWGILANPRSLGATSKYFPDPIIAWSISRSGSVSVNGSCVYYFYNQNVQLMIIANPFPNDQKHNLGNFFPHCITLNLLRNEFYLAFFHLFSLCFEDFLLLKGI